ncbi:RBBP8 N-terminal-like protein isoform X2 [Dunckerocampus dactyliophorus]|uniref:RBBP8 N-terminal-like protein isoform X2 n=1 Tax=Dunckerocampus dactyliophorus TaxID=161453 RepID=UPI002407531D|nr:RBBP8 N-terminal-like protein isoform X2 [Dunckerocampus dactyliophorus]
MLWRLLELSPKLAPIILFPWSRRNPVEMESLPEFEFQCSRFLLHTLPVLHAEAVHPGLRAGLCDRCTVTQEVAKRRQQEFEVMQMQTLQHVTVLGGENNTLKKENRRLRDEIGSLRDALNNTPLEAKTNISPDLSPSSEPMSLIATTTGSTHPDQPTEGNVAAKTDTNQSAEEHQSDFRQLRAMSKSHVPISLSAYTLASWKTEHSAACTGDRSSHIVETLDHPPIPPQALLLKTSSPPMNTDVSPRRHSLKAPIPCRPQPIKSSTVPFPWALPESSGWTSMAVAAAAAGTNMMVHPYPKPVLPRFPNLVPTSPHTSLPGPREHAYGSQWHKQSGFQSPVKEPTVVFRLKNISEHMGHSTPDKSQEKKDTQSSNAERVPSEGHRDLCDGPLDLSDRGKSKSIQMPLYSQDGEGLDKKRDKDAMPGLQVASPATSQPLLSSLPTVTQEEVTNHTVVKEQGQNEEANGKMEQSNGKKVPALTISLRPVVVLETLNSALQTQDSLPTNGKSSPTGEEPESSEKQVNERVEEKEDEEEEEEVSVSGQEKNERYKRKRLFKESDSDTDIMTTEKKVKITVRNQEKTSS